MKVQVLYRKRKKPKSGQAQLLICLWQKSGGPSVVAAKVKVNAYMPANWIRDGRVPVKFIGLVAEALKVPVWGLNYKAAAMIYREEKAPIWKKVVESYGFSAEDEQKILELPAPTLD